MPRAALLAFLLLLGCDATQVEFELPPPEPELLPLAIGHTWIMQHQYNRRSGDAYVIDVDTLRITRDTLIQGKRWYYLETKGGPDEGFYTNRNNGVWYLEQDHASEPTPVLRYLSPARVGDAYGVPSEVGIDALPVMVANLDASHPIQQAPTYTGTLYALRYTNATVAPYIEHPFDVTVHHLLAPEVGFVVWEIATVGGNSVSYELLQFIPGDEG